MRFWPLCIFISALALRLVTLSVDPLWYDESFSAAMTRLPVQDMMGAVLGDVHPPLWYFIQRGAVAVLGSSPFALRLPAALASALAAVQGYHLLRDVAGDRPGQITGILLTLLPGQLNYGQEGRSYALFTLLVLMGIRLALTRNWLAVGLVVAGLNWTHNLAGIYSLLLAGWALIAGRRRALPGLVLGGLLTLPWLAPALDQARHVGAGFWLAGPENVGGMLHWLSFTSLFNRLPSWAVFSGFIATAAITLVSVYVAAPQWRKAWPLFLFGFGPAALMGGVSLLWHPILLDRALVPSGAVVIGLWAMALPQLSVMARRALVAVAAPTAAMALASYVFVSCGDQCNPIFPVIEGRWQQGDAIYHLSLTSVLVADYYMPELPSYILPETGDLSQSLSQSTKESMGLLQREIPAVMLAAGGVRRIWAIFEDTPMTSDQERLAYAQLVQRFPTMGQWIYPEGPMVTVTLTLLSLDGVPRRELGVPRWCVGAMPCSTRR